MKIMITPPSPNALQIRTARFVSQLFLFTGIDLIRVALVRLDFYFAIKLKSDLNKIEARV
jgi:hypothetical protein